MDGNEAVQRAVTWWESFGSESARRAPEALAALMTDLAHAIEDVPEPTKQRAAGMVAVFGGLQSRAKKLLDSAPAPVQAIAGELNSIAVSNRESLLRVAEHLQLRGPDSESADRFRSIFDNAAVAISVATSHIDGRIIDANPAFTKMFSRDPQKIRGLPLSRFVKSDDVTAYQKELEDLVETHGGTKRFEAPYRRPDGLLGWALVIMTYVPKVGKDPDYLLAVAEDITGQRSREEELHWQANHDVLTSLPNRRYLQNRLEEAVREAQPGDVAGLCFIDLDRFKSINDTYGHTVGDQVLCSIAERLSDAARVSGEVAVRIGGDEFVVFVQSATDREKVMELAYRLRAAFDEPIDLDDLTVEVGGSIGVDFIALEGAVPSTLLVGADRALYRTKADGTGVHVYRR